MFKHGFYCLFWIVPPPRRPTDLPHSINNTRNFQGIVPILNCAIQFIEIRQLERKNNKKKNVPVRLELFTASSVAPTSDPTAQQTKLRLKINSFFSDPAPSIELNLNDVLSNVCDDVREVNAMSGLSRTSYFYVTNKNDNETSLNSNSTTKKLEA